LRIIACLFLPLTFNPNGGTGATPVAAALSAEYAADGQAANAAYDQTWTAAIALVPQARSGELTPEQAVERLPVLAWPGD
jgi:hypothetical protein